MGQKYGFLIPDTYVLEIPNEADMNTSSIFWGLSLGIALFTAGKAGKQTLRSWKRSRRLTAYVFMIWAVWWSSLVLGILAWTFQRQYIPPRYVRRPSPPVPIFDSILTPYFICHPTTASVSILVSVRPLTSHLFPFFLSFLHPLTRNQPSFGQFKYNSFCRSSLTAWDCYWLFVDEPLD